MSNKELDKYINLAVIFDTFKYIPRLATKRIPIIEKESVSTHIYEMIYLGYLSYSSMEDSDRNKLDFSKIIKLILWHEADESITNDIPYPAKKQIKLSGNKDILGRLKSIIMNIFNEIIPDRLFSQDRDIITDTFDQTDSAEKRFVKFLDYVNLYLNAIQMGNKGYSLDKTIDECKKLTMGNEYYDKCPLINHLMKYPNDFISKEFN